MKKLLTILTIMLCTMIILTGSVFAGAVSIKASKSSVNVGQTVSVTVSFGGKVSAAQFKLNYDKSKFDYVSCSAGTFGTGTNTYVYVNYEDVEDLGSVTLTFKAKATGSGDFSISGVVLSGSSSISNSKTTVKVNAASSSSKKPTTTKKPSSSNKNTTSNEQEQPVQLDKTALEDLKSLLGTLNETDYTEDSWKALQEAIGAAEGADTEEKYNEVKDKLTVESLVKQPFEKEELNKVLRDLIGKVEKDYTEESWRELQEAIDIADSATLKSQYDAVKDKLTINNLILEEEKGFFGELAEKIAEMEPIVIILIVTIIALIIIIIVMAILYDKVKKGDGVGRRLK